MSTLLKDGAEIQPFAWREETLAPPTEPSKSSDLIALEHEVSHLRRLLRESAEGRAEAVERARALARADAEALHKRADAEALDVLRGGVASAIEEMKARVLQEQTLALLLAQVALEKVFGDAPDFRELVARAIHHQVKALRRESIVSVHVSAEDFRDESALTAIATALGGEQVNVVQDAGLASGDCRINLRLGHIELSISEHWQRLQDEFRRLAGGAQ